MDGVLFHEVKSLANEPERQGIFNLTVAVYAPLDDS
jgi:hypothetical protein